LIGAIDLGVLKPLDFSE